MDNKTRSMSALKDAKSLVVRVQRDTALSKYDLDLSKEIVLAIDELKQSIDMYKQQ